MTNTELTTRKINSIILRAIRGAGGWVGETDLFLNTPSLPLSPSSVRSYADNLARDGRLVARWDDDGDRSFRLP